MDPPLCRGQTAVLKHSERSLTSPGRGPGGWAGFVILCKCQSVTERDLIGCLTEISGNKRTFSHKLFPKLRAASAYYLKVFSQKAKNPPELKVAKKVLYVSF